MSPAGPWRCPLHAGYRKSRLWQAYPVPSLDAWLLALEIRGALFKKGCGAFSLVFRRAAHAEQRGFKKEAFRQRHVHALVHRFHAVLDRQRGHADDLLRDLFSTWNEPVSRNNFIHQADAVRFLRGNHFSREKNLHGQSCADEPRQTLRAAIAGNEAELYFRLTEFCVFAGQAHGTGHSDLASAAQGEPVDAANHRLAEILNQVERGLTFVRIRLGFHRIVLCQLVDVRACDEGLLAATRKDDNTNLLVIFEVAEDLPQLLHGGHVERVEDFRAVNGDVSDLVFLFEFDVFHAFSTKGPRIHANKHESRATNINSDSRSLV